MRALVLAGGGMRGAYTSGVVDALSEMGHQYDAIYGTSSGGANGAWLAAGQTDTCIRSWDYAQDPRILNYRRFLMRRGPLLDLDTLLFDIYPNELLIDLGRIRKTRHPVYVTVADVDTGRTRFLDLRQVDALRALRATSAMPFATGAPVTVDGARYLDGGLTTPVPIARALHDGADEILVVLNKFGLERRGELRGLAWYFGQMYPKLARAAFQHHEIINDSIRLAESPPEGVRVQIIRPQVDHGLSRFTRDPERLTRAIAQGRADAYAALA